MKILPIILIFLLSACCHNPVIDSAKIDSRIYQECQELPDAKSSSDVDLLDWSGKVISLHAECKKWKTEENKILKKSLNIK